MNFSLPRWLIQNRGKATHSFKQAVHPQPAVPAKRPARRAADLISKSAPGLQDGPKPHAPLYAAGKRAAFNANWREEHRRALTQRPGPQFNHATGRGVAR